MSRASWESWSITPALFSAHKALYRLLGGRLAGKNVLILTTRGRRSGLERSTPLFYARDGGDYIIVASNGGEDRYPAWWHNLKAHPHVHVQVRRDVVHCKAERVGAEDVPRLWAEMVAIYSGYETYRAKTRRELTLLRLKPRPARYV